MMNYYPQKKELTKRLSKKHEEDMTDMQISLGIVLIHETLGLKVAQ